VENGGVRCSIGVEEEQREGAGDIGVGRLVALIFGELEIFASEEVAGVELQGAEEREGVLAAWLVFGSRGGHGAEGGA